MKKSVNVNDNTKAAKPLGKNYGNPGIIFAKTREKQDTNVMKNPGRALEFGAKVAGAALSESTQAALSTIPSVINFYITRKVIHLGKVVDLYL